MPKESKPLVFCRAASAYDIDDISRIENKASSEPVPRQWFSKQILKNDNVFAYLGCQATGGKTVGYMMFVVEPTLRGARVNIIRMATDPFYQRTGVMSSILQTVVVVDRPTNVSRFVCTVPEDNLPTQLLLRKYGFRVPKNGIVKDGYQFILDV